MVLHVLIEHFLHLLQVSHEDDRKAVLRGVNQELFTGVRDEFQFDNIESLLAKVAIVGLLEELLVLLAVDEDVLPMVGDDLLVQRVDLREQRLGLLPGHPFDSVVGEVEELSLCVLDEGIVGFRLSEHVELLGVAHDVPRVDLGQVEHPPEVRQDVDHSHPELNKDLLAGLGGVLGELLAAPLAGGVAGHVGVVDPRTLIVRVPLLVGVHVQ
mmetsp:Transcript_29899/g.29074  ORF Transcript_29899/g.29074 Transcript_29899/m.29074 type:complete len:212 (-) Transcript_29899:559-1194(-)